MKKVMRDQYMMFNGIKLVSVFSDEFPFDQERCKEMWHIPGREIMSTDDLIDLATKREVPLNRTVYSNGIATTTALN